MGRNRNDGFNNNLQFEIRPNVEPDNDTHPAVTKILNITLANEAMLAMKTRGARWNVHGPGFFDRRTLYIDQHKQMDEISDEISKRARVLGGQLIGSFGEFLQHTQLVENPGVVPSMAELLADHKAIIGFLREEANKCFEEYQDEISRDLLMGILTRHEKMAWMLHSLVEPGLNGSVRPDSEILPTVHSNLTRSVGHSMIDRPPG